MKINLKNCGNIKSSSLVIEENKLNIKYGLNGIGKSTLIKALDKFINDPDNLSSLIPFSDSSLVPEIEITDGKIENIMCFNESYVSNFLFKENDVLRNSYEILVHDNKIEEEKSNINSFFIKLNDLLNNENILKFKGNLTKFKDSFPLNDSGSLKKQKGVVKGLCKASPVSKISDEVSYKQFVSKNNSNKFVTWHKEGNSFLIDSICPYCFQNIEKQSETLKSCDNDCNATDFSNLNQAKDVCDTILEYLPDDDKTTIKLLLDSNDDLLPEQEESFIRIYDKLINELDKLEYFSELENMISIDDWDRPKEKDVILYNLFDTKLFDNYPPQLKSVLEQINSTAKDIVKLIYEIEEYSNKYKKTISTNIESNQEIINDFLKLASIPYKMIVDKKDFSSRLVSTESPVENKIDADNSLSYGERNSLSLILFAIDAIRQNPDLIVIDDPISSFDQNKRYSILYTLFSKDSPYTNLSNKTVLLVTHDFNTVIDIVKNQIPYDVNNNCYYLYNCNGVLSEKEINKLSFVDNENLTFKKTTDVSLSLPIRICNFRRICSIKNLEKHYKRTADCLIHMKKLPLLERDDETTLIDYDEIIDFNSDEKTWKEKIRVYLPNFDYYNWEKTLYYYDFKADYMKARTSYEKIILTRFYLNSNNGYPIRTELQKSNQVIYKYLSEYFHTEHDLLLALDPDEYDTIPQFLVKYCDYIMSL